MQKLQKKKKKLHVQGCRKPEILYHKVIHPQACYQIARLQKPISAHRLKTNKKKDVKKKSFYRTFNSFERIYLALSSFKI